MRLTVTVARRGRDPVSWSVTLAVPAFLGRGAGRGARTPHDDGPRPIGLVARLSLAAQDRAEHVLAGLRERPLVARLPGGAQAAFGRVRLGFRRSTSIGVELLSGARDAMRDRLAVLTARPGVLRGTRATSRAVAAIAVVGFVAVGVLGLGRPSAEAPSAAVPSDAPAPVAVAPAAPPVAATPPAAADAPDPAPRTLASQPSEASQPSGPTQRIAQPVSLRVPAIDVDAPVVIVGLEPDGAMEIPADVRTVGWYEPFPGAGVVPGERGTAVIAGHVDSRTQGRGAFWPLRELEPGDVVEVAHEDGTTSRWRVDDVVRYPKTDIPIDEIFTFDGDERLALITCGGEFDRSIGAYLDNYVVTASPLPSPIVGAGQALPTPLATLP